MNLYKISQTTNNNYDTYDSAIVAAESEDQARYTEPSTGPRFDWKWDPEVQNWWTLRVDGEKMYSDLDSGAWVHPSKVQVEFIGTASENIKAGIILASFNAG